MTNAEPGPPSSEAPDHAGVRVPPPALFLGALLIGIGLEWQWPLSWLDGLPSSLRYWFGGGLVLAGAALMAAALRLFRKAGTAIPPWEPTTALVTTGVYRLSRNPVYVAMVLLYVGLALIFATSWALLFLAPVLATLQIAVIRREEAYLDRRFGEPYRQYHARVRRWL